MQYLNSILEQTIFQLIENKKNYLYLTILLILIYISLGLLLTIDQNIRKNIFLKRKKQTFILTWSEKNHKAVIKYLDNLKKKFNIKDVKIFFPNDAINILTKTTPLKLDKTKESIKLPVTGIIKCDAKKEKMKYLLDKLKNNQKIDEVIFEPQKIDVISNLTTAYNYIILYVSLLYIILIFFVTSCIFKIMVLVNEKKLKILHLVGASPTFIKLPFILCSLICGIVSSIIGVAALRFIQLYLEKKLNIPPLWLVFDFLNKNQLLILIFTTITLPVFGSWIIARKIK